jgi:hypothetical protein
MRRAANRTHFFWRRFTFQPVYMVLESIGGALGAEIGGAIAFADGEEKPNLPLVRRSSLLPFHKGL